MASLNLGNLPVEVLVIILRQRLVADRHIRIDSHVTIAPGHLPDAAILRVCRIFNQVGTTILYGANTFNFYNPTSFSDFTANVGPENALRIRRICILPAVSVWLPVIRSGELTRLLPSLTRVELYGLHYGGVEPAPGWWIDMIDATYPEVERALK